MSILVKIYVNVPLSSLQVEIICKRVLCCYARTKSTVSEMSERSVTEVTPSDTDDHFYKSLHALDQTLWDCLPFLVQCCCHICYNVVWEISLTYPPSKNVPNRCSIGFRARLLAGQGMARTAFRCRKPTTVHAYCCP